MNPEPAPNRVGAFRRGGSYDLVPKAAYAERPVYYHEWSGYRRLAQTILASALGECRWAEGAEFESARDFCLGPSPADVGDRALWCHWAGVDPAVVEDVARRYLAERNLPTS